MKEIVTLFILLILAPALYSQVTEEPLPKVIEDTAEVKSIEERVAELEKKSKDWKDGTSGPGMAALLFGIFCAWWALQTERNAWLWFFLGAIFTFIAGVAILIKDSNDRKSGKKSIIPRI